VQPPVILVHGFLASPALMVPMRERLQRRGFRVSLVSLPPLAIQDIERLTDALAWNIERALRRTGAEHVDLVGVSLGGLLALRYSQRAAHLAQVRRIVALGSPFGGSALATLGAPLIGWLSAGIGQVRPGSAALTALRQAGVPDGVTLTSIAMRGDLVATPTQCDFPGATLVELPGVTTPLTHQWLIMSTAAVDAIDAALR